MPKEEPFITFTCDDCGDELAVMAQLKPGEVAVLECNNCKTSYTIYSPQLEKYKTKELPKHLQDPVWRKLSE